MKTIKIKLRDMHIIVDYAVKLARTGLRGGTT